MSQKSFHTKMVNYLDEYRVHLSHVKFTGSTTHHISIIKEFLDFIYNHHLVGDIGQITKSMCCSKWMTFYKRKKKDVISKEVMKKILKGYFVFLDGKYGIRNEKLMNGFNK